MEHMFELSTILDHILNIFDELSAIINR